MYEERLKTARAAFQQIKAAVEALNTAARVAHEQDVSVTFRIHNSQASVIERRVDVLLGDSITFSLPHAEWRIVHDFSKD